MFDSSNRTGNPLSMVLMVAGAAGAGLLLSALGIGYVVYSETLGKAPELPAAEQADFAATPPVTPTADSGIDLEWLHTRGLPLWGLEVVKNKNEVTAKVREKVAADPVLADAFEVADTTARRGIHRDFDGILGAMTAWNEHQRETGQPWRTAAYGRWRRDGSRPVLTVKGYRVLSEHQLADGERTANVEVVARADNLNVAEGYLYFSGDGVGGSAMVIADRAAELSQELLWPVLDPANDHPRANRLRAQLRQQLGEEAFEVLTRTAPHRSTLERVKEQINARTDCSNFVVRDWSWYGTDRRGQLSFEAGTRRDAECPQVTRDEYWDISVASAALWEEPDLAPSLQKLAAVMTESLVVKAGADQLACDACDKNARSRAAWLAGLTNAQVGEITAYHLCTAALEWDHRTPTRIVEGLPEGACSGAMPLGEAAAAALQADFEHPLAIALDQPVPPLPIKRLRYDREE